MMSKSDTVAIIRSLLSSTKNSYSIYSLNKDFKKETGVDIPLYGYGNISDFLHSIPDTVKITGMYPIQQISLVTNEKSAHIVSLVKSQKTSVPKGRFSSKFKPIRRVLDTETNFRTPEYKDSKIILEKRLSEDSKDKTHSGSFDRFLSSKNFCWTHESIPAIDIKSHTEVGQYIEVFPCWIFSPNKFYFHLRKFKRKFHDFTKKLQMFYTENEEIPYLDDDVIKPKQPCAVFYKIYSKTMWHRAEIKEVRKTSKVIVDFVDYGYSAEVSLGNIKFLHQDFQSFPRQAILGFLANIKPLKYQSEWSQESIQRFYDLAFQKDLIGGVVHMNDKDVCIGMALSSTGSKEIHINDTLVKEGYAEFDITSKKSHLDLFSKNHGLYKTTLVSSINENVQNSKCFFTNDYCVNVKLKKMFSAA